MASEESDRKRKRPHPSKHTAATESEALSDKHRKKRRKALEEGGDDGQQHDEGNSTEQIRGKDLAETSPNTHVAATKEKKQRHHKHKHSNMSHEEKEQERALKKVRKLTSRPTSAKKSAKSKEKNESVDEAKQHEKRKLASDKRRRKKDAQKATKALESKSSWKLSENVVGGQFIDIAPIFSQDEKFIIFATPSSVHAYSTSNSLLVHSLRSSNNYSIIDYRASATQENVIYVLTDKSIMQWDIKSDTHSEHVMRQSQLTSMACFTLSHDKKDVVLTAEDPKTPTVKLHILNSFSAEDGQKQIESVTLLKQEKPIREVKVFRDGRCIIGMTINSLIVGKLVHKENESFMDTEYIWREIPCPENPTCFDLRVKDQLKPTSSNILPPVDIVIGGLKGCIYMFEDLVNKLFGVGEPTKPNQQSLVSDLKARELHWHRESVGSVTWSKDGNYLISGGQETVLVLWQLETGRKQFLPHLESPIQHIVVSPSGTSYGIRLADNSVMVLSTSELNPTANVNGIQSLSSLELNVVKPILPTVDLLSHLRDAQSIPTVAAVVNPRLPDQLLLATPAYQINHPFVSGCVPAPYLQTFDISNSRQMNRQPLLRTNATNVNLGPEGNKIREPNLRHIKISHDGVWLATVDEWSPPADDLDGLTINGRDVDSLKALQRESHLKFWKTNTKNQTWMMNTRIDSPHELEGSKISGRTLDLVTHPSSNRFASIGEDSTVRIWKPKSRKVVNSVGHSKTRPKDESGSDFSKETWWTVEHSIQLEQATHNGSFARIPPTRACLAYSNDGSALVVNQYFGDKYGQSEGLIQFIDADNGHLTDTRSILTKTEQGLYALGFLEQYLICLSRESATVIDVISLTEMAYIPLQIAGSEAMGQELAVHDKSANNLDSLLDVKRNRPGPHLAIDLAMSTFAISYPEPRTISKSNKDNALTRYRSRLKAFSLITASGSIEQLYDFTSPRLTMAMLPAAGMQSKKRLHKDPDVYLAKRGFVVLDAAAELRFLRPTGGIRKQRKFMASGEKPLPTSNGQEVDDVAMNDAEKEETVDADTDEPAQALVLVNATSNGEERQEEEGKENKLREISALLEQNENETRPVVRPEQLAEVFDHPSHAMPSVLSMFDSVIRLFSNTNEPSAASASSMPRMEVD